MPELPEVETLRRQLEGSLLGKSPVDFFSFWKGTTSQIDLGVLGEILRDQPITTVGRRGKYFYLGFDVGFLLFHLKMTGRLYLADGHQGDDPWTRFSVGLTDQKYLIFSDARKFGRVRYVTDLRELGLGPEPLEMTPDAYRQIFRGTRRRLKALLLDQTKIAGIGNIYADESLFEARIHPLTPGTRLSAQRANRLASAIQVILLRAIRHEGATISWYRKPDGSQGESQKHFRVYGKANAPCPRCGTKIKRILVNQRSTHYCGRCQRF